MSWEKKFDAEKAYKDALQITKAIKYFDNHIEIINEIRQLAEQRCIDEKELEYHINKVYEAKNELESAVFNLVEPFEDAVRYADDDDEDLDENMNDRFEKDFADIFGDLADKVKARKRQPDHSRTQAHQDKTKKIPRKDKYKDNFKKDVTESSHKSSIIEALIGGDRVPEEEVYVLYLDDKPAMKFANKEDAAKFLGQMKVLGIKDFKFTKEVRPISEELEKFDEGKQKGLWANIHAKRKRGEPPAKPGEKGYPKTLDIDEEKERLDPKCWKGYKKQGTKMKGGVRVNNCVPVKESTSIFEGISKSVAYKVYESELAEGNGRIRAGLLAIAALAGLLKIDYDQAQEMYANSHQMQQLIQVYQAAEQRGDEEKMRDVRRRIKNHELRLDLGKGDVDFDGDPRTRDDIKDLDYINSSR